MNNVTTYICCMFKVCVFLGVASASEEFLIRSGSTERCVIDMHDAQELQHRFDDQFFEINEGFAKMRHVLLHLMKTVGKFATYCEAQEHGNIIDATQLLEEVLPDLLLHALQIANAHDIDLGEAYIKRINFLIERNRQQRLKDDE